MMLSAATICMPTASLPRPILLAATPAISLPLRLLPVLQISGLMMHHRGGHPVKE
jgi:hypothetical protein